MRVPSFEISDEFIHHFLLFCASYGLDYESVLYGGLINFLNKFGNIV